MIARISVNTLSLAPAPLSDQVETVTRTGLGGITPEIDQVTAFGPAATAQAVRDAGLEVAGLTHRAFGLTTPAETAIARERLLRTIDIAHHIGARSIVMTTGGRGDLAWAQAAERFAEGIAPCAEAARAAGILLGIEPTSHLYADASLVHRLTDTARLARMAGIGVACDLFACWVDCDIEQAIAEAGPSIGLIQVSDYVYGDRGLPCRAVPGDGAVPLDRLISAIVNTGFDGWYDLEVIGPRLQAEGQEAGLRRAADHVRRIVEGADR